MPVTRYVTKSYFVTAGWTDVLIQSYYDCTHFLVESNFLSIYNLRLDTFARPISRIGHNLCPISVPVKFCIKYKLRSYRFSRPFSIIGHNMCPIVTICYAKVYAYTNWTQVMSDSANRTSKCVQL